MKTLTVTNMAQMFDVLKMNPNQGSSLTTLDDIDDDIGDVSLDINNAIAPELPKRDFNIATLTPEKLEQLRKGSNN